MINEDKLNALLSAVGYNLRLILLVIELFLLRIFYFIYDAMSYRFRKYRTTVAKYAIIQV